MTFSPVIPTGGIAGWAFLDRTGAKQRATFAATAPNQRDEAYFREKIGSIKTAEALVADRRLLSVALGAFGLDADINNKAFLKKVLADGTLRADALGNRLADKQYLALAGAFAFDLPTPSTRISTFPDKILSAYRERRFEIAVGAQNNDMRLALNARRELATLAERPISETSKWLTIMGNPPLRQVFEKAFGLPAAFVGVDLDRQVATLQSRAERVLGRADVAQFSDPARVESLLRQFLARGDATTGGTSAQSSALQLLQSGSFGANRLSLRL